MSARGRDRAPVAVDVLIVSLGSTAGLRAADEDLAGALRRAGMSVTVVSAARPAATRTLMLTDLGWARAARAAAIAALRASRPRAIVYSTTTAALLWPAPGAIRFDAPAAGNRPGWDGLWQRPLERRRLAQAPLLMALSEGGLAEAGMTPSNRALVVPLPVEASGAGSPAPARDIDAITYAGNPHKKGLDRVLAAWRQARGAGVVGEVALGGGSSPGAAAPSGAAPRSGGRAASGGAARSAGAAASGGAPRSGGQAASGSGAPSLGGTAPSSGAAASGEAPGFGGQAASGGAAELVVAGASRDELRRAGIDLSREPGVRDLGPLPAAEYRALLRRARVFVTAPRREDYGQAQLEALADGCLLATTPAPGPYAALPIARRLDPSLVDEDLAAALARALSHADPAGYAERARAALAPLRSSQVDALVAEQVLPRLLRGAPGAALAG